MSTAVLESRKKHKASWYRPLVLKLLAPMNLGYMKMTLPDGSCVEYGSRGASLKASARITNENFFKRCVLHGDIGFGEAYVEGDWETDDLTAVIEWMILNVENHPTLMANRPKKSPVSFLKIFDNLRHRFRSNTVKNSRKNISAHYDLGNEFYKLFLDPGMTYSSAYFSSADASLEEAQAAKYENLCRRLKLRASDHVLEIGCGWGGFAEYAARKYGCRITGITISKEQFAYAEERLKKARVDSLVELRMQDYRHVRGQFDKIVSIEMIEAVGHEYLDAYFSACHRVLKKDGLLALQMILAPDHRYESFRKKTDWIQKHIFPGGLLPSFDAIQRAIRRTGELCIFNYEDMTPHYARTLRAWRESFNKSAASLHKLGFDEEFIRKWNYYFSYCEAAFSMRNISVAQAVFSRPNNHAL